jgi:drug/metabolite transporter (DMT)-like permease
VAAIALALGSSLLWGAADFWGGTLTRRLAALAVASVSQVAGFAALLALWAVVGESVDTRAIWIGAIGGLGGGFGLACFYKALAIGTMSIVSPIAACGAAVPLAISLATGEHPAALALAGVPVALLGAVLASLPEHASGGDRGSRRQQAVLLAVATALGFGVFLYLLGLAGRDGSTFSALFGARLGSLALLGGALLALRRAPSIPRAALPAVVAVGIVDVAANGLYTAASARGLLSIVAVLGSLYPVVTVILAHLVHGERITKVQLAGVTVALVGVGLVSAG